jgi:hypothetical protein
VKQQRRQALRIQATVQARVAPVLGAIDESGAQRISLDVPAESKEVLIGLAGERPVATLVDMAGSRVLAMGMVALGVSQRQPGGKRRKLTIQPGPDHQVPMVWHDAIGEDAHAESLAGFLEYFFEREVVLRTLKQRQARVGAVEHMINDPAGSHASRTWHGIRLSIL